MSKYIIAFVSLFDNVMKFAFVLDTSKFAALSQWYCGLYGSLPEGVVDEESFLQEMFDQDMAVGITEDAE